MAMRLAQSEADRHATPSVPPQLIVSHPTDETANTTPHRTSAAKRRAGSRRTTKEQGLTTLSDWIDIDESPSRRKRTSKRPSRRREQPEKSSGSSSIYESSKSDLGRYFPKLSRILESSESLTSSRPTTRGSDTRQGSESSRKRHRHRDNNSPIYRRPARHRTGGVQRRGDSLSKINPSLLSVLTSLTSTSDKSSGSNSTITQRSYNRRGSASSRTPTRRPRSSYSRSESSAPSEHRPKSPNVFDFMVTSTVQGEQDTPSRMPSSSTSSHYEPSLAGSSETPDTPSSRSTLPSPTSTRSQSVAELRRKYDPQYTSSSSPSRSGSQSPPSSSRNVRQQPSIEDIAEDEEENYVEPIAPAEVSYDAPDRSSSRSSRSSQRSASRLRKQEETMRQHMAYAAQAKHAQHTQPMYPQRRSTSMSSTHSAQSDQAAYAYQMAMQQYHWPPPPPTGMGLIAPQAMNGHLAHPDHPLAPDAPDLSQRTITGYEMLALELSATHSPVKPLYRKFEYLNHRLLLHLQDELSELEEQLRTADEVIAQLEPEGQRSPASRRAEAHYGTEIHHRRRDLLGRIFIKTEQYSRAMTAYTAMVKDASSADEEEVRTYHRWMSKHAPIHELETRFLQRTEDLIVPCGGAVPPDRGQRNTAVLSCVSVALMLPLLLYSIIPTLSGRLAVTALMAVGAFIVVATTRVRSWLPAREWAVCGAAYVLLMAAVAGCVPQHSV